MPSGLLFAVADSRSRTVVTAGRRRGFVRTIAALFLLLLAVCATAQVPPPSSAELERWQRHAEAVTIIRDDWGIAHVNGRTDADAVFGMVYAQAEDDFNRVETNYVNALGRLAEAEGEGAIYQDLRMRLFNDPADLRARYAASPEWLQRLMSAWADGLNFYLRTHPQVRPRVIRRFEPWMALSFTEGSIGGDIERISVQALQDFYSGRRRTLAAIAADAPAREHEPSGSNGIAIAPANTTGGHALLLINPHTSFFFRSELQVTSEEGLNAYGAATGPVLHLQGFNERLGWMHTSSGVDVVDEFERRSSGGTERLSTATATRRRPLVTATAAIIAYRTPRGDWRSGGSTSTHHRGPIIQGREWPLGQHCADASSGRGAEPVSSCAPRRATIRRTCAAMAYQANSSNNTISPMPTANIAYLHPQYIPRRDDRFDYSRPVDGSDPATGLARTALRSTRRRVLQSAHGWIQNTNNWPIRRRAAPSPEREAFPRYMDTAGRIVASMR